MRQQLAIPKAWRLARASAIDPNPANVIARAATFAASTPDGTVLVTRRDAEGLGHYIFAPDGARVGDAAMTLAQTLGARLDPLDVAPDVFTSRHMVVARHRAGSTVGRDTQAGAELGEVSLRLATILKEGEWVAAVIRTAKEREKRWHNQWLSHQTGGRQQHHSTTTSAVVMSLWAGSTSAREAKDILNQVAAALPGFDLKIEPVAVSTLGRGLSAIAAGAGLTAASLWLLHSGLIAGLTEAETLAGFAAGAGLPIVVGGVLYIVGRVPSYAEKVKRFARFNRLLFPNARHLWLQKPKRERSGRDGEMIAGTEGKYPLNDYAFLAGPHLAASLVAPQAGAASGTALTQQRIAPSGMNENIGPVIGDNDGRPVHIAAGDAFAGVFVVGQAGSGKSRLVQFLFAWAGAERVNPTGKKGFPGKRNTLVAFESKGDGADAYAEWATVVGDKALRIDFAGSGDVQLDILSIPGNAERKARAIVNGLKYAFSDGSIQERSFDTLVQVFSAAFAVTPEIAATAEVSTTGSPFYYANILLGGRGDPAGVALAAVIKSEAARQKLDGSSDLGNAAEKLQAMYEGKTPAQRAQLTDAPRNKVSAILAAETWWARPKKITWDAILQNHLAVIVNTGITQSGDQEDDQLVSQVSALMMYTLYEAIKRNCSGWFEEGRGVSIYADELKLLAGSSATVITWLRDQGRGYGVRPVFATQYPEQLDPLVRKSVMGFGTLLAFAQNNPEVVQTIVSDLKLSGDAWEGADVANLPAFETIVRATVGRQRQTPFTVKIRDFWGQRESYSAASNFGRSEL